MEGGGKGTDGRADDVPARAAVEDDRRVEDEVADAAEERARDGVDEVGSLD